MGLDQNWIVKKTESIAYHRKFNALEGFMAQKWKDEGNDEEFNCCDLLITEEILDELETTIKAGQLLPTSGFFFGNTEIDEYYKQEVKELLEDVIPMVRDRMTEGQQVYYTSWW